MIKKVQKKRKETHSVTIARASSMLFAFKYQLNITLLFSLNIFISPCLFNEAAHHIKKNKPNKKTNKKTNLPL